MKNLNVKILNNLKEITKKKFPRASEYDFDWVLDNSMAPNPLWFTEILCNDLELEPGMRVLDLGCGKAISSIFMAKEYGVQVWATDLWIDASENMRRIKEAAVEDLVYPVYAEAHSLPYPEEFFDVVICISSYEYFGTDELYYPWHLSKVLKHGGKFAFIQPGLIKEFDKLPENLKEFWSVDMYTWHSNQWWSNHIEKTGLAEINISDIVEGSFKLWLNWEEMQDEEDDDAKLLRADNNEYLTWIKLITTKK